MNDDAANPPCNVDPPTGPAETVNTQFTAQVAQAVRRRRRNRNIAAGSFTAIAVAAGLALPTLVHSPTNWVGVPQQTRQITATHDQTSPPVVGVQLPEKMIVHMIMAAAIACKDPSPASIQYVYGSRNKLSTFISGDTIEGAEGTVRSVLVEASGNFTMIHSAPVSADATSTGNAISIIINLRTGDVTDSGISKRFVALSPLGHVFHRRYPN